ncbi:uncharacterized protein LOC132718827 [Ruditapes philippinarum]|jgi:hypothetical protein|uniref:uncharacterized protein LOC132718827 n=1 Tax=Ruditapes philippinarum TaxID=129788 RepID=UPI00295BDAC4|nr:uncharacterized protein LOC132718827 [Ruditapes philippinarum]
MVGHTHEDIDQVFSRISCHMKHVDAPTLPALLHAIGDSTTPSPQVVNLEGIYNYKATLENVRGMIEGISGPHQFMIKKKEGKVILHYKDWPIDKSYKTLDIHERIPEDLSVEPVLMNPKMKEEAKKMENEIEKWKMSGRLGEEEVLWWRNYLKLKVMKPNVPKVNQLPKYKPPVQNPHIINENVIQAIQLAEEKEKKRSNLKLKGRKGVKKTRK